jgi:opacity protein-like surface antigen
MKTISTIIAVFIIIFSLSNIYSQNQVTVHVTGGYDLPMQDFKGTIGSDTNNYVQKSGFNVGADGKYYLGKKRNVGVTLSLGYNGFTSGTYTYPDGSTLISKINIFVAGLGIEYAFMPKGKANPFIGAEFTGNFFGGSSTFTSSGGTVTETSVNSASRFGVQFNGGVDIKFSKSIGGVIGIRYSLANLIGKKYEITSTSINLNDAAYTSSSGINVSAKNISYLQFYGGISFYLGRK